MFDRKECSSAENVSKGAYILKDARNKEPQAILIATGSEVYLALQAQALLETQGVSTRVVSAPCLEWFEEQPQTYRDQVLPPAVKARVSIEAGVKQGWREYVGDHGVSISLERFGASASASKLFAEFGFTPEKIVESVLRSLS